MISQNRDRWRLRAAVLGAILLFCVGWAGFLAALVKRAGRPSAASAAALRGAAAAPALSGNLLEAAAAAQIPAAEAAEAAPPPRALLVEHDEVPVPGSVRHLVRATVPPNLSAEELRHLLERAIDDERMNHAQVDAVAVYLYEEAVYARFTGRVTPLDAAVAHGIWAPAGDWARPARAEPRVHSRAVYVLPQR